MICKAISPSTLAEYPGTLLTRVELPMFQVRVHAGLDGPIVVRRCDVPVGIDGREELVARRLEGLGRSGGQQRDAELIPVLDRPAVIPLRDDVPDPDPKLKQDRTLLVDEALLDARPAPLKELLLDASVRRLLEQAAIVVRAVPANELDLASMQGLLNCDEGVNQPRTVIRCRLGAVEVVDVLELLNPPLEAYRLHYGDSGLCHLRPISAFKPARGLRGPGR